MSTETVHKDYQDLDTWPLARSLEALVTGNLSAVRAVQQALPQLAYAAGGIERALASGGRLIYAGAGTSGRLAMQDAAELPPTFGFERTLVLLAGGESAQSSAREDAEDDTQMAIRMVENASVGPSDALMGVAASGATAFTVAAVRRARQLGAFTVALANNPNTPLLEAAEAAVLLDTGPEVLAGSTRLTAGTAQKIALNALSTAVLVRLGGAYGNLMVGMKPKNAKLRRRARAIVQQATGVSETKAAQALEAAHGQLREAIVMLESGLSPEDAAALLAQHDNRVRDALAELRSRTARGETK